MAVEKCSACGKLLGSVIQETMFGQPKLCVSCETTRQARYMFAMLPKDDREVGWDQLSEWEQGFLTSMREQFERKGRVSERQFEILERIYVKLR